MIPPNVRIPNGIHITEPVIHTGSVVEKCADVNGVVEKDKPKKALSWCYLFIHHSKVAAFAEKLSKDKVNHFIHKTVEYQRRKQSRGIQAIEKPTVNGLVFLQGTPRTLQTYLNENFENRYLVKNCSTRLPAVIPDSVMQPFMRVMETSPERIRFLLHPFQYYAGGNIKLRITSGFLAGLEGYVIRIDRDRRLVMDVGGMSVAISGVHCETFEVVK
jgi:hypothetical protein